MWLDIRLDSRLFIFMLFVFLIFLLPGYSLSDNRTADIKQLLESRTDWTEKQVEDILGFIEKSKGEGLPVEVLINRLKEGVARGSNYTAVLEVLTKKINSLKSAKELIYKHTDRDAPVGVSAEDIKYSHQLLAELLGRGLAEQEFEEISGIGLSHGIKMDELVRLCEILITSRELGFPSEYMREIILLAVAKGMRIRAIEYLSETLQGVMRDKTLKPGEIKDIIVDGLNRNRSVVRIKRDIKETARLDGLAGDRPSIRRKQETTRGEISETLRQEGIEERIGEKEKRERRR